MADLFEPLTPPDCDLRGLEYMPLLGQRLFGSEFNARATDSEWRAAVTLWWAAWTQCPAASLPDDDVALCRLADLGRDLRAWRKVKKVALHGFEKCSDGRLYHKTLAEQAMIAWEKRLAERERKAAWRAKRAQQEQALSSNVPEDVTGTETGTSQSRPSPSARDVPADGKGRDGTGRDVSKEEGSLPPEKTTNAVDAPDGADSRYAFSAKVIRLNDIDLAKWRKTYHAIADLEAELTAIDCWLQDQPEASAKAWFHSVPRMLNRKHQEIVAARAAEEKARYARPIV